MDKPDLSKTAGEQANKTGKGKTGKGKANKPMSVRATDKGHYGRLRESGDKFEVDFGANTAKVVAASKWLEPAKNSKASAKADAEE